MDSMEKNKGYKFWENILKKPKYIVAPMVDQSELPWRLLSRRYGAELCYTPMLHAPVFVRDPNYRKEALISCPEDRPLLVQFCANDPETLLKAAKYTEDFCDGVDLNLGCPQAIARRGHYGAFLSEEWELLHKMISLCAVELKIPITAKIRIFDDINRTVEYAKMLESAGVQILTVHGRTKEKKGRKTGLASWEHIKAVKDNVKIPVFANGNIQYLPDVHSCMKETGVDGVMSAEGNLHNPGLFDGRDHKIWDMATEYIELVEKYPCPLSYVRGHIFKLCHHALQIHKNIRDALANSKTLDQIKECVEMVKEYAKIDVEAYERDPSTYKTDLPRPYWICQPYVRPTEEESSDQNRQKAQERKEELENLKRAMSAERLGEEELSRNKLKKLKKHHRRNEAKARNTQLRNAEARNVNKEKYSKCGCGNPKGLKCEFDCCKVCCRDKAFREKLDCPGHKLFVKSRLEGKITFPFNKKNKQQSNCVQTTTCVNREQNNIAPKNTDISNAMPPEKLQNELSGTLSDDNASTIKIDTIATIIDNTGQINGDLKEDQKDFCDVNNKNNCIPNICNEGDGKIVI